MTNLSTIIGHFKLFIINHPQDSSVQLEPSKAML